MFDFDKYIEAAVSAAYETIAMRLEAPGTVELGDCGECGTERYFLRVDETGQLLELVGDGYEVGAHLEEEAEVRDWDSEHPRLYIP